MKKITAFLIVFVFIGTLYAQNTNSFVLKLDHMALSVKDLDRSIDFYTNVLKFSEITNLTRKEGIRWVSLGEGKELHLVSTIKEPVIINKAVHLAFKVTHFNALIKALKSLNITYSDWPGTLDKITVRADGIKQIYIQDPDGYWIEINSDEK
ncbi:VOC family protein [Flavobacterium glaciei]|uniref:Catechol 2,3-dioxygenase-like lactoylglutathione lyase family enzyme n=1 Tax=Flavobacterium glaciei TaxID=386300 RepID=A0A562PRA3_9FLAO|nr:VOC family protein [Flavobacterium glaciei]RDI53656.1 catechol 2,3-dioxygenase-like lactoylglutathione lyase family enzyme [Flavobacterium glaciei]TWI46883.1 catechol 2,3-dioxygenase-like lactoylglutathione lyase family enzyme [Flavobacterium glaciei]